MNVSSQPKLAWPSPLQRGSQGLCQASKGLAMLDIEDGFRTTAVGLSSPPGSNSKTNVVHQQRLICVGKALVFPHCWTKTFNIYIYNNIYILLYYIILYCIVLYCIILYYIIYIPLYETEGIPQLNSTSHD